MAADTDLCRCGHILDWHQHFHDRRYCGTCGPAVCPRYRKTQTWLAQTWLAHGASRRIHRLLAVLRRRQ